MTAVFEVEQIQITKASLADVPSIKEIEVACGLSPWTIQSYEIEIERNDSVALVARIEGLEIVGFLIGRLVTGAEAEIHNIGVLSDFRKRGIGHLLIGEFKRICSTRGSTEIWLEVRASNAVAIDFYRSEGFASEGRRTNFYSNPAEDAVLMRLRTPDVADK